MRFNLKSCVWELTLACCFSCKYCGSGGGKARDNELSTEECLMIVDELSELGCERVSLIGGEVFMRRDWKEIVHAMTSRNISVAIITNGYALSNEQVKDLKEVNIESVAISLDGLSDIHDRYRMEGSFEAAKKTLFFLAENGINVSLISTLNRENVEALEEFYEQVKDWPIKAWQLQACSPMGNVKKTGIDYRFSPLKVIHFVEKHMYEVPFNLGIADNIGYYSNSEGYLRGNLNGRAVFSGCRAGISAVAIDSVGNVRGCESMYDDHFIEGNIRERSLSDIWNDPDKFEYNRKFDLSRLTGNCAKCMYAPNCAGGCRSYNYFVHNNIYESPMCVRNSEEYAEEIKVGGF